MEVVDAMQIQAKALADPTRFRLFRFIAEADRPVGVAELTELMSFNHNAIRQHLAVLVDAQLVAESNEKRKVRGRPRKQYEVRDDALNAFARIGGSYERLAGLLLELAESNRSAFAIGFEAGRGDASGHRPGDTAVDSLAHSLSIQGFEPERQTAGVIKLNHCPFAGVATRNASVVCELHRGLVNGYLAELDDESRATLEVRDPTTAGCLVTTSQASGRGNQQ